MDKMKMESKDIVQDNIEAIGSLFPSCVTESCDKDGFTKRAIDFDKLKQFLTDDITEGSETYEFTWVGKKASFREATRSIRKTLRPSFEESVDWDSTENIYIEGDNLEALKLLRESYLGRIKMIYIDPPYNTGHDFIYPDSFVMSESEYSDGSGYFDEEGNINYRRENTVSDGRYHSDWCSMLYSRLLIARDLLTDDGAILMSIDDNEAANALKICDDVFGSRNFVAQIPWRKRTAKSDVPFGVSQDFEWVVCYAKSDKFTASIQGKERKYYESPDFPGERWRIHDLTKQTTASERPNSFFTIVNPKNGDEFPANPNRTWAITEETFKSYYAENRIVFPGDYSFLKITKPALRYWERDDRAKAGDNFGRVALSSKLPEAVGMSQDGTKELTELFDRKIFPFPKPSSFIKYLVYACTKRNDIVLDFFSGTATTAHAVMQLNAEDGGNRRFIMVQLPEPCSEKSDAFKAGYSDISQIGKKRIVLAAEKIKKDNPNADFDAGFRVFKIDDSNMKDVFYPSNQYSQDLISMLESNIKEDRTDLDLLFGCISEWGLPLSLQYSSEVIDGNTVHFYHGQDLAACFDADISENTIKGIANHHPLRVVLRDAGFISSPSKINVEEIFKLISPDTRIKVL